MLFKAQKTGRWTDHKVTENYICFGRKIEVHCPRKRNDDKKKEGCKEKSG